MKFWGVNLLLFQFVLFSFISCKRYEESKLPIHSVQGIIFAGKEETLNYLNSTLESRNDHEDFLQLARIAINNQEFRLAENCLLKYFSKRDPVPEAFYLLGYIRYKNGDLESANNYSQKAITRGWGNFEVYNLLGCIYYGQKKYDSALLALNIALNLYPANPDSWAYAGKVYLLKKDTAKSLECFNKALTLNPLQSQSYEDLINIYIQKKELEKAAGLIQKSLLKIKNIQLYESLFDLFIEMNKIHEADSLIRSIQDWNDPEFSQLAYAKIYYAENLFDSSIVYADKALSINENNSAALSFKGKSLIRKNRLYEALSVFEKIVLIDSTDAVAKLEIDNLNRKIAYLRKIQQEYESRPVIKFLEPIKRNN